MLGQVRRGALLLGLLAIAGLAGATTAIAAVSPSAATPTAPTGNLLVVLKQVADAAAAPLAAPARDRLEAVLPRVLRDYALFMGVVAGLCTLLAVLRLRAAALKGEFGLESAAAMIRFDSARSDAAFAFGNVRRQDSRCLASYVRF